jgi:hypothetical protein
VYRGPCWCTFSRSQPSSAPNSPRRNCAGSSGICARIGVPELCGVEVAERVGREVADRAHRPVDVLQAAAAVVGHLEAEVGADALVPGAGQLGDRQVAGEQRALQVEAQHDVEVVRRLVAASTRIRPGSTRFIAPVDLVGGEALERRRRGCASPRASAHSQNSGERPTMFSQSRDWLSWMPRLTASLSGWPGYSLALGRFCSYRPCPASCSVELSASGSRPPCSAWSAGCRRRPHPRRRGASRCRGGRPEGRSRCARARSGRAPPARDRDGGAVARRPAGGPTATPAISGTSSPRSSAKTCSMSAERAPGSYSSSSAS